MSRGGDALKYGATGAITGSAFGPAGAAIGGGLGALGGLVFGGGDDGRQSLQDAFKQVSSKYAAYRPEDFARRKLAVQQAMSLMDPARNALGAAYGFTPVDYNQFFTPPGGGPGGGTNHGPHPRTDPTMNIHAGPVGTPPAGPPLPPPSGPWRGGAV